MKKEKQNKNLKYANENDKAISITAYEKKKETISEKDNNTNITSYKKIFR